MLAEATILHSGRVARFLGRLVGKARRADRRRFPRFLYRASQHVAPLDGDEPPPEETYREVQCCDISVAGISFLWPEEPDFPRVAIRLRTGHRTMTLAARVVYHYPSIEPEGAYRVGCCFLDELESFL